MSEQESKQGLDASQETEKSTETNTEIEQTPEQLRAELEKLRKQTELTKNEISTRDKKLTELQKDLKARLSEEERIKMEAEQERKEWLDDMAKIQAETLGLDEKHAGLIKGANKQEIKESAELIKSLIDSISGDKDKQIKKLEDELKTYKAAGDAPKGAKSEPAAGSRQSLINQYNEAEAKGDADKMFYLKEQIRKLPKT
jgi:chromosome segregation ATPase